MENKEKIKYWYKDFSFYFEDRMEIEEKLTRRDKEKKNFLLTL